MDFYNLLEEDQDDLLLTSNPSHLAAELNHHLHSPGLVQWRYFERHTFYIPNKGNIVFLGANIHPIKGDVTSMLIEYVEKRDLECIAFILESPDIIFEDSTLLDWIVEDNMSSVLDVFLKYEVSLPLKEPMIMAYEEGLDDCLDVFLDHISSYEDDGMKVLHWASKKGHHDLVCRILESGIDVNSRDNFGYTPLIFAAKYDQLEIVQSLIETFGADFEIKTDYGYDALKIAKLNGYRRIVQYLKNLM